MSDRFQSAPTPLDGATVLHRQPIADRRGYLERLWCDTELGSFTGGRPIRQINRTLTRAKGTVRGLHFQRAPSAEAKFVHCLRGQVFDVAVDLRRGSATFGQWHAVELSGDGHLTYLIPEGFAHGFQTLTDDCELLYMHTVPHSAEAEGGINPCDPGLAVAWPLPVTELSPRDQDLPVLDSQFDPL